MRDEDNDNSSAKTPTYRYRPATSDDASEVLAVLVEVAPEIPVKTHGGRKKLLLQQIKIAFVYGVVLIALDRKNRGVGFLMAESKQTGQLDLPYGGVREGHRGHHIFPDLVAKMMAMGIPLTATVKHANKFDMVSRLLKLGFTEAGAGRWPDEDTFRWQP